MTDLEKRAEEYACEFWFDTSTSVTKSTVKELLIEFAQSETELVSKHLIEMQKTNGALTDRVNELTDKLEHRNCLDCSNHSSKLRMRNLELEKENAELTQKITELNESFNRLINDIKDCAKPNVRYDIDDLIDDWDIELEEE